MVLVAMARQLRAARAYRAWEQVTAGSEPLLLARADADGRQQGALVEHRVDASEVRNEAAFINDCRDDVSRPEVLPSRPANVTVVTTIVDGQVHALVLSTKPIAKGPTLPAPLPTLPPLHDMYPSRASGLREPRGRLPPSHRRIYLPRPRAAARLRPRVLERRPR